MFGGHHRSARRPHRRLFLLLSLAVAIPLFVDHTSALAAVTATDAAADAGIFQVTTGWDVAVDDFDGDGLPDVLIGRHRVPAQLYRNEGGHFVEAAQGTFPQNDRHDCEWADVDQDGLDDLYCSTGAHHGDGIGLNELWMQGPAGSFTDRAAAFGVTDKYGRGRRVTFFDFNHDAYPDLFVGNQAPRKDSRRSPNRLFVDAGGTAFEELRHSGLTAQLGARCVQAADYNGDGWDDLLVCGHTGRGLTLYRNQHGTGFKETTHGMGLHGPAQSAQLEDLDADGDLDLVRIGGHSVRVQMRGPKHFRRTSWSRPLRAGIWLAIGDVNRDSAPDLYVVQACDSDDVNVHDILLVNAANGFSRVRIPEVHEGCGNVAAPIDFDQNGTTDFIVLNGKGDIDGTKVSGPVQLISFA